MFTIPRSFVVVLILITLTSLVGCNATTAASFNPITVDNVDKLTLGYAIPGICGGFSPDNRYMVVNHDGLYDVSTGEKLIGISTNLPSNIFSPDSKYLAVQKEGVYEISSKKRLFDITNRPIAFSPDSKLLAVEGQGVFEIATGKIVNTVYGIFSPDGKLLVTQGGGFYDVATWKQQYSIESMFPNFSPDGKLLSTGLGLSQVSDQQQRFALPAPAPGFFSPDGKWLATQSDPLPPGKGAVYEVETGQKKYDISGINFHFSGDNSVVVGGGSGVYDLNTGQQRFAIQGGGYDGLVFSADSKLLAVSGDAIYDVKTGDKRFTFPALLGKNPMFSSDGKLLAVSTASYVQANDSAQACLLFGAANNSWPNHHGLVKAKGSAVTYDKPSGSSQARINFFAAIAARTGDSNWYKVMNLFPGVYTDSAGKSQAITNVGYNWVRAKDVDVIYMPDNIAVEG